MNSKTDGEHVTTGVPTVFVTKGTGVQTAGTGASTHKGNGGWQYAPSQTETDDNEVKFSMVLTGAITQMVNIYPVAFDPTSSTDLGLLNLDTTISSRNSTTPNTVTPPTVAELNARTILASAYFDPTADTVLNVATVATLTGHTAQSADHAASITAILDRIGAFTGSGVNNILGFFRSLLRSDIATDPTDIGGTFDSTTDSVQGIRDRGDTAWITGGGGGITDMLNIVPLIPNSVDLADTATVRIGLMLTNALDDLPSTVEITPGTISIDRKAIGGAAWIAIVVDAACLELAGLIYFDEVFNSATGYAEGDSLRVTFKSQFITVSANVYEITDAAGRFFYTEVRQTMRGTELANTVTPPTVSELNARTILSANYATDGKQDTAQSDLDKLTGADGVTLATLQANYAPAKSGDPMTVSDKTGFSLSVDGILAIWHQLLSAITTPLTIGKLINDFLDITVSSRNAIPPNTVVPLDAASTATSANQGTILNRIGGFTGSGINNILGFFQAIFKSDATLPTDMGGTGDPATDSLQAIRDHGDVGWITGGAGGISDILNIAPLIPCSVDLANTATVRLGLMLINSLDDLPSTSEITPGTISIDHKAIGGAAWLAVVIDAACLESAGLIYFDEVFDAASGYSEGDSIRITFKSQKITVSTNDYEITDANGRIFYTEIRQTTGAGVADWTAAEKSDIRGALGVVGTKTTGTGGQIQALPTFAQIWETALTESYAANGAAPTPAQFLHMLYSVAAQAKNIGTKHQTFKIDGATLAMEFTLDDPNNATSRTRTL